MARVLYAYLFLDDFVLLYPVYTLLFSGAGLTTGQIASLLVAWSAAGLLFEVPSGALADVISRRRLLVIGPLLTAVAFALWTAAPGYWVFLAGFVLWGLKTALTSGALEALVYEELQRVEAAGSYTRLMGRGRATGVLAAMAAGAVAAPVLATGGYGAVGAGSVVACLLACCVAILFPEHRRHQERAAAPGWTESLTGGVAEARRSAQVRSAVVLVTATAAVWGALDEYTPLLLESTGLSDAGVALLMVVVWAGAATGGLLAGRITRSGPLLLAALTCCGAALLAGGALTRHPLGVLAIAAAFGMFQLTTVLTDARLQDTISGSARATITSLAGMSTEVATLGVYASYAALAGIGGHSGAFAVLALPYLATAAWLTIRRNSLTSSKVEVA